MKLTHLLTPGSGNVMACGVAGHWVHNSVIAPGKVTCRNCKKTLVYKYRKAIQWLYRKFKWDLPW